MYPSNGEYRENGIATLLRSVVAKESGFRGCLGLRRRWKIKWKLLGSGEAYGWVAGLDGPARLGAV